MGQHDPRQSLSRLRDDSRDLRLGRSGRPEPHVSLLQIQRSPEAPPLQPLVHLDALWLQVAGTLCNLTCTHCFVSCGPDNHHHPLMSRAEVRERVTEALDLGVKESTSPGASRSCTRK